MAERCKIMKWWGTGQENDEILPEDVNPEEAEKIIKQVADEIVKRRLTAPAIFLLESSSPLNFIGSQAMIALEPFIKTIFNLPNYRRFALLMEGDKNVKRLIEMIEFANYEQNKAKKVKG
jgi:hypothetical protein